MIVNTAIVPLFDLYDERVKLKRERSIEGRFAASKFPMT